MKIDNFFAELRLRKVLKVGATYLVGRVAGRSGGGDGAADCSVRPNGSRAAAILFAWAFELTACSKQLR